MTEVEVERHTRVIAGTHARARERVDGLGIAAGTTFEALGWAFRDIIQRRRLKKLLREAGDPVALSAAGEGLSRVEGRVETLEPVMDSRQRALAAYVRRVATDGSCECRPGCRATLRVVETRRAAGRFLVRDATGVAVVAGPAIRLLDYHGRELDPMEPGALEVSDGDSVTVVGHARHETADDPRARVTDGYRGAKLIPVFHGDQERPVHVFCAGTRP